MEDIQRFAEESWPNDPKKRLEEYMRWLATFADADKANIRQVMPDDVSSLGSEEKAFWVNDRLTEMVVENKGETAKIAALIHLAEAEIAIKNQAERQRVARNTEIVQAEEELDRLILYREKLVGMGVDDLGTDVQIREGCRKTLSLLSTAKSGLDPVSPEALGIDARAESISGKLNILEE